MKEMIGVDVLFEVPTNFSVKYNLYKLIDLINN